jgi:hypothetical protein
MIIIFDTFSGLCNQFFDIYLGINFCINNNIKFTFRFCSFREKNLVVWNNEKFEKLFDLSFLKKYDLYIDFKTIENNINENNTFNFYGDRCINIFKNDDDILKIDKEFIILKQFWSIIVLSVVVNKIQEVEQIYPLLLPSNRLIKVYNTIKSKILNTDEQYNFIHYRYEQDFIACFKCSVEALKPIILNIKQKFKNPNLRIYIATSNITKLIDLNDTELNNMILTKNEDELTEYNFEELAFIDYMFGLNSNEVFGHSKSSFSHMLNNLKGQNNFYA